MDNYLGLFQVGNVMIKLIGYIFDPLCGQFLLDKTVVHIFDMQYNGILRGACRIYFARFLLHSPP